MTGYPDIGPWIGENRGRYLLNVSCTNSQDYSAETRFC